MATRHRVALAAAAIATTAAATMQPAHAATNAPVSTGARVRVIPDDDLHVGQDVTVVGTGLSPNSTYTVAECSRTLWVVPQNPCTATTQVTTNHAGRFHHRLHLAPCTTTTATTTTMTCYIGIRHGSGIDVVELDPHTPALTIRAHT